MPDWTSETGDARILHGSCLNRLRDLPECSVQCCVTSPPYWGLRDYGHSDQLGLEPTPEAYVANMVAVFREVRRVLREDGVLFLNLGDSYASGGGYDATASERMHDWSGDGQVRKKNERSSKAGKGRSPAIGGLKPKDLVGIPWRVAFALQADGWWLRQDIIWHKPNPMPESVTDRCTKAHEYIFLLTKSARYYYDSEAVKEVGTFEAGTRRRALTSPKAAAMGREASGNEKDGWVTESGFRNRRSVWTVSTKPYSGAHFATYPPDLIEPCILAGTSERGRCKACGAAWERVVEKDRFIPKEIDESVKGGDLSRNDKLRRLDGKSKEWKESAASARTIGWQPTCQCNAGEPIPCLVLDPFNGSGTTGEVCIKHGRHYVGCEVNPGYVELAKERLSRADRLYGTPLFS